MISSSLRQMRQQCTVSIYTKSISGSYSETAAYSSITATHEQRDAFELVTDTGATVIVTDVFWLEKVSGSLPVVNEGQVLVYNSVRYEIMQVLTYDYGQRVRVMTRRAR